MIDWSPDQPLGSLRLRIVGAWSVRDLQMALATLEDTYNRTARVMRIGELIAQEQRSSDMTSRPEEFGPSWDHLYFGGPYYYGERVLFGSDKVPLERIVTAVEPFTPILFVDAVELRSPGFLQVIGKLNPLTAITKFISRWRAENTKRLDIAVNADLERERLRTEGALERDRIRSDFALGVIGSIPPSQRPIAAERLSEIIDYVINPTTTALQTLATDPRIIDAEVVSPGTPLPAKKRKKRRR